MTSDEADAIEAFERLGLTNYEAKVFIALQRLGSGTAREISDVVDVPRSQVYSVAETLEERGLLEVQQSSPIRYRAVSSDEAQRTLEHRFEHERERPFDYVEEVCDEANGTEAQENVWIVRNRKRVTARIRTLLDEANRRVLFGTRRPELVDKDLETTLERRAGDEISVTVITKNDAVRDRFVSHTVTVQTPESQHEAADRLGRVVIVDDDTLLLSVISDSGTETAIWSSESLFAAVLVQLAESELGRVTEAA